jgi:hypothetical protein
MVGAALGAFAITVFGMWAGRRHIYAPLTAGLSVIITGTVAIVTGAVVSALRRVEVKAITGWAAAGYIVWSMIAVPGLAQHVGAFLPGLGYGGGVLLRGSLTRNNPLGVAFYRRRLRR